MIIKIGKTGAAGGGIFTYLLAKNRDKPGHQIGGNLEGSPAELAEHFKVMAETNPRIQRPVWHAIVAWHPSETISDQIMAEVADLVLEKLGIDRDNHQHVVVRHDDGEHPHCHLVLNRVGFDGSVYYNERSARKAQEFRAQIEQTYGFVPAQREGAKVADLERDLAETHAVKRGYALDKNSVHQAIRRAIDASDGTFSSFDHLLSKEGLVHAEWNFSESTGRFHGGRFALLEDPHGDVIAGLATAHSDGPAVFKGSQVGWSASQITKALQKRLLSIIHGPEPHAPPPEPEPVQHEPCPPRLPRRLFSFTRKGRLMVPWARPVFIPRAIKALDRSIADMARNRPGPKPPQRRGPGQGFSF